MRCFALLFSKEALGVSCFAPGVLGQCRLVDGHHFSRSCFGLLDATLKRERLRRELLSVRLCTFVIYIDLSVYFHILACVSSGWVDDTMYIYAGGLYFVYNELTRRPPVSGT